MGLKRAFCICDHGTADHEEDGFIDNYPFYAVLDGLSEPHSFQKPAVSFNGMTGGEMIINIAQEVFRNANPEVSLEDYIPVVNIIIAKALNTYGLSLKNAGQIPGAAFLFLKIEGEIINLIQGGDCLAVWRFRSGEVGYTVNQAYNHVAENLRIIREILERNGGNREEMWVELLPILSERRQQDINNPLSRDGYAVLNGQSDIQKCWQSLSVPVEDLEVMIAFSDGSVPYQETSNERIAELANRLLDEYQNQGLTLEEMLEKKRKEEIKNAKTSYITHDEATVLALEFDDDESKKETLHSFEVKGNFFILIFIKQIFSLLS